MTPIERLEIILQSTVPEDSKSPYAELDSLYMHIFAAIYADEKTLLLDVLAHLLRQDSNIFAENGFAQNNAVNIEGLFCLPIGKTWTLFRGLHSILIIPDNDRHNIAVRHTSFIEFLTDRKRSREYFVDNCHEAYHERIAVCLIKRLVDISKTQREHANAVFDAYAWESWNAHCQEIVSSLSDRLLDALQDLDLCALLKTAMLQSSTNLEACVLALRNCMDSMESIAQWAKHELNPSSTTLHYRTLKNGFRLQLPSQIQSIQREELELALMMLKYGLCLDQPNSTVVISALLKRCLTPEQFGNTLRDHWPNLTILPLKIDPLSQLHPDISMVQSPPLDPHDGAHKTVNIIFSDCHREISLHFLQIIQLPSQETDLIYAQSHWIHHLLITVPSKKNLKTLLKNMSSLKTSEDAEKASIWIKSSNDPSGSRKV
ncbi:hypothetical protein F5880DRAFT_1618985 [Lentinula raphanica]|nr:hypothetical protein F5880DRAFT_1618985 [Lentinula raphanica]